eukprot:TRINITY_DN610_c0_g1_i2.p1 TRINITY_DN610_c0_g1~~TRINITY_DN610_c0_g1_i2.p1  ORF type:complete len:642 (+),score=257.69 TRINITY_DN610_c0_g1_i2:135-2060(+)
MRASLALLLCASCAAHGYFVVSTIEQDLATDKRNPIFMNSLDSRHSMVTLDLFQVLPNFPRDDSIKFTSNPDLGSALMGEKVQYFAGLSGDVKTNLTCQPLIPGKPQVTFDEGETRRLVDIIQKDYRLRLSFFSLKAFTRYHRSCIGGGEDVVQLRHLPLGVKMCAPIEDPAAKSTEVKAPEVKAEETAVLYNHFQFFINYNKRGEAGPYYVTRFQIRPVSRSGPCGTSGDLTVVAGHKQAVNFTYDVSWVYDPSTTWEHRWDYYMEQTGSYDMEKGAGTDAIVNSLLLIACLTLIVGTIIMRTLHLDFNRYNNPDNEDEMQEEVGWKLVHTDVFRPPSYPNLFAIVVATGSQVVGMMLSGLLLAYDGFASPTMRGRLLSLILIIFALLAVVNGYTCGRLQMMFGVKQWKTPLASALLFPGFVFLLWGIAECLVRVRQGGIGVSAGNWCFLLMQWWGISLPLVVIGASGAFKQEPIKPPIPYKQNLHRNIPQQHCLFSAPSAVLLPGLIVFVAVLNEVALLADNMWLGIVHILFGYLALVALLLALLVAETTVVFIYYQLAYEDYRWWWKSLLCSSGLGVYCFVYSLYFASTRLQLAPLSWVMFVLISIIVCTTLSLVTSTIGFYTAWTFTTRIYNAIKIE